MGTAQVKAKTKNTKSLVEPPKVSITVQIDPQKQIPVQLLQLTNWSLQQIKEVYQTYQRLAQSPMLDSFLFKKILPFNKKNGEIIFSIFSRGEKYVSVFELICILVMTSYQTYRKKSQFICLIFDFEHKGFINGKQFLYIFYSMLYGYCRLTQQKFPNFDVIERFGNASFFSGEDDFESKPINLRKFFQQYDGNSNISTIFNRFQRVQLKQVKEDPLIYTITEFRKFSNDDITKFYRIIYKIYSKNDYEQMLLIQQNKQLRRQNRRDSCYRELIQEKYKIFQSPLASKRTRSVVKLNSITPQTEKVIKNQQLQTEKQKFRIKKIHSTSKIKTTEKKRLIFLNGKTYSKNQIFGTINYFKKFAESDDKISIKQFFKRFDNKAYLKKQLSSIFKFLDYEKKGQISLESFFRSFYPGINQDDIKLLTKWYSQYQEIYEADSLARNQVKVAVMSDARVLPYDTFQRMKEIFKAMDIGNKGYLSFEDMRKAYKQGFTADQLEGLLLKYGDGEKIHINGLCKMLLPMGWTIQGIDINQNT